MNTFWNKNKLCSMTCGKELYEKKILSQGDSIINACLISHSHGFPKWGVSVTPPLRWGHYTVHRRQPLPKLGPVIWCIYYTMISKRGVAPSLSKNCQKNREKGKKMLQREHWQFSKKMGKREMWAERRGKGSEWNCLSPCYIASTGIDTQRGGEKKENIRGKDMCSLPAFFSSRICF